MLPDQSSGFKIAVSLEASICVAVRLLSQGCFSALSGTKELQCFNTGIVKLVVVLITSFGFPLVLNASEDFDVSIRTVCMLNVLCQQLK